MSNGKDEIMTFKVKNDEGVEVECEVLFTFESDETKKIILSTQTIRLTKMVIQKYMPASIILMNRKQNFCQSRQTKNGKLLKQSLKNCRVPQTAVKRILTR